MTQGIYVSAAMPGSGKSLITLGLATALHRRSDRLGFFRPIAEPDDPMVAMIARTFNLDPEVCRSGLSRQEARALLAAGKREEIYARCVEIYAAMSRNTDVIISEGTDLSGQDMAVEFDLNARLANDLGALMLSVVSAQGRSTTEIADAVDVTRKALIAERSTILAMMVNRADPEQIPEINAAIRPGASGKKVYILPEIPEIAQPTVDEVTKALKLRQITGSSDRERDVAAIRIGAMTVSNFLAKLVPGALVISPGDRADVVVGTLAAALSPEFPAASGMILTGGIPPDEQLVPLLAQAPFPVFDTELDTYQTARLVSEVRGEIWSSQRRKYAAALGAWSKHVDENELLARLDLPRPQRMTPLRFLRGLMDRAQNDRKHIVLPEGEDVRILRAAEILHRADVCELTILGGESDVRELASIHGLDISGITVVDPTQSPDLERFAEEYARLRAHKGVDLRRARGIMVEPSYFGTMMVQLGVVDGMVSGAAHTTANTIRPALEFVKTAPGVDTVSSVFLMLLPDRVLVYGDCAVIPEPTVEQLADIAVASARTAEQFGVDPRVAMLSYSTGASGSGEAVDEVRQATELVKARRPDLLVEGPIQYDAAVDASIGSSKLPGSEVAGQATVFIFPDLNTGNNTYKAVQQSSGAVAVGPVLQGLRKPINDLSRGCTVEDIVNTVCITAVQAQGDAGQGGIEAQGDAGQGGES